MTCPQLCTLSSHNEPFRKENACQNDHQVRYSISFLSRVEFWRSTGDSRRATVDLNGHEAGNGGYGQRTPKARWGFPTRKGNFKKFIGSISSHKGIVKLKGSPEYAKDDPPALLEILLVFMPCLPFSSLREIFEIG